jgi:hypothetical protein
LQFPAAVAENYEVGPDGSSLQDEPGGLSSPGDDDQGMALREPFLRRVLAEFEAGHLEAYEYTQRVLAINVATSTTALQAIVDQRPDASAGDAGPGGLRGLDAVDLARLKSAQLSESRSPTTRYVTLAVVFVLFAVLIGVGVWLAGHVHAAAPSSGVPGVGGLAALAQNWP